jgi:asparagine synthase (glutamine-hydrolysing)
MCGIAGFVGHKTVFEARAILERMTATLLRRGPDDQGTYVDQACALGVRRLAVIDLHTGHQPVPNEDGTIWVVQNGEIYNFRSLRDQLRELGHVFRTQSDTEVIVHAYEAYGEDCVTHLDGMFAFAVWDSRQQLLLLGRDRMGEKPLYYHAGPDVFVFGSELRALLSHPAVPRHLDLASLERYLAFEYIPTPHSILTGVEKLAPGHLLTVSPGSKPHVARYWDLSFAADPTVGEQEWQEALLRQLGTSVRAQLATDVPLGLFLSGGVDSSGIVALASLASSGQRMKTFSLGFSERSYDERPFAEAVARACGTEHREVEFSAADASELLERAGDLLDEPLADGSFLPIYRLSQVARREVTVVLSGDGGDELFCGYPTFQADKAARLVQQLPQAAVRLAAQCVERLVPSPHYGSAESLLKRFFRALPHAPEIRAQLLLGGLTAPERSALLSPTIRAAGGRVNPFDELAAIRAGLPHLDTLDALIYQHCKLYLAEQNLVAVDRASMACGLEVRAPFLDRPLVELAARIPATLKLKGWRTKHILKRALRGLVPDEILNRRKQGFGVPFGIWMRGPLREVLETRLDPRKVTRVGLFDPRTTARLMAEHVSGARDHQKILWALLMFDAWRERYLPGERWS